MCSKQAEGGTLFVNGLEDLPTAAQRAAARCDRDRPATRGSPARAPLRLDARIIVVRAAGCRDARRGTPFRIDAALAPQRAGAACPPLREYAEDVPELLRSLRGPARRRGATAVPAIRRRGAEPAAQLSLAGQHRASSRTSVHRLLIQGGTEEIRLEEIERGDRRAGTVIDEPLGESRTCSALAAARGARAFRARLSARSSCSSCNGKVGQLAKRVGMERTHLYRKLRSLGVDFRQSED